MSYNLNKIKVNESERIYFPELDGLRFFAFLLVFVHHQSNFAKIPFLSILSSNGWIGVDLFFILSAFLFTKLLIAEFEKTKTINLKKFYIRRVFRIWPIYFLFIGFSIAIYFFTNNIFSNYIVIRIIGLFTFSDNIMTALYGYNPLPYLAHLWSITYEEQFYLFIPIVILSLVQSSHRKKITFLISIYLLFSAIRFSLITIKLSNQAIWVLPVTHFESILFGIIIGFGGLDFLFKKISALVLGIVGVLLLVLVYYLPNSNMVSYWLIIHYSCVGISTSMVLFAVLNSNYLKLFFSYDLFVFLGKRSYGLYLYHLFGNAFAIYLIKHISILPSTYLASFCYSLFFTISVSIVSYKLIETPFLTMKKKFEIVISRPI